MNTLPSFARACARRTTTLQSKPTPPSSTLCSLIRPQLQHQHLTPSSHLYTTSTTSSSSTTQSTSPPLATSTPSEPHSLSTSSPFLLTGTITRTGTMKNCIQITQQTQVYDPFLQKHYTRPSRMLIHDPHPPGFLVEGDVVEFGLFSEAERAARLERKQTWDEKLAGVKRKGGRKAERTKWRGPKMVVRRVVTAFGTGVDERMERIAEVVSRGGEGDVDVDVVPASKKGRGGKQHASAKVAG